MTASVSLANLAAAAWTSAKSGMAGGAEASVFMWLRWSPPPILEERRLDLEGVANDGLRPKESLRSRSLVRTFGVLEVVPVVVAFEFFCWVCAESRSRCSPELVPGRDLLPLLPELTGVFPQVLVVKKAEPMPLCSWNAIVVIFQNSININILILSHVRPSARPQVGTHSPVLVNSVRFSAFHHHPYTLIRSSARQQHFNWMCVGGKNPNRMNFRKRYPTNKA